MFLESTIQSLRDSLTKPGRSAAELNEIEQQLTLAEKALEHYRHAYTLELNVSGSEPPYSPETESKGGTIGAKESKSGEKKDGLALVTGRATKRARVSRVRGHVTSSAGRQSLR